MRETDHRVSLPVPYRRFCLRARAWMVDDEVGRPVRLDAVTRVGRATPLPSLDIIAAAAGVRTRCSARLALRTANSWYRGSRSFIHASNGLAMKIDE